MVERKYNKILILGIFVALIGAVTIPSISGYNETTTNKTTYGRPVNYYMNNDIELSIRNAYKMNSIRDKNIFVIHGNGPFENARQSLANIDAGVFRGKSVLIKPNAGRIAEPDRPPRQPED